MIHVEPLSPPPRLLMGPGPINADPRVLRAMSAGLVGQFDPWMTSAMNDTMACFREVFRTENHATFLVDGTARAGIEAALVSLLEPGDRIVVLIFGRFGHLLAEIAGRCGADVHTVEVPWGQVVSLDQIEETVRTTAPKVVATVHGDTSTTMCQPLEQLGDVCRQHGALLYVDVTASIVGNDLDVDQWGLDVATAGLQKCLAGPSGSAPVTFSSAAVEVIARRKVVEAGIREPGDLAGGHPIASNYFDVAMLLDYWGERRLNHHTEATSMLYAARECARIVLAEGLDRTIERHRLNGDAMRAGVCALGLGVFGDPAHKMNNVVGAEIPVGLDGHRVRTELLERYGIEIGTSFGPLHGRIWRIGTMGHNARQDAVLTTLAALEQVLRRSGHAADPGAGVDAAIAVYDASSGEPS
jgi:(S)-ureidoglycine-glyoxylate aminotransferase